jgi:hypothetical protein
LKSSGAMAAETRPKVKFLLAVWGERYIAMSAAISVPSFLAPGNLPALAAVTDLEVLIMTAVDDVPIFRRTPAFQRLEALCPIRFIPIDELIVAVPPLYGFTLTQAFAHGIASVGAHQTSTHFVFMNADFVLADGSLRSLADRILAGHPCILAPSFRVDAEAAAATLRAAVDPASRALAMAPRPMVALALANMHPTSIAKTLTQDRLHCRSVNQLYWSVDAQTMVGHAHLLFMLCIKPERPLLRLVSYCDYAFVPEMVPSGRLSCLDDSDDFFMLELQATTHEQEALEPGPITREHALRSLAEWTTAMHRRAALFSFVLHAADPPPAAVRIRQEAATFIRALHADMPQPLDYVGHRHWMDGLELWRTLHDRKAGRISPPLPASPGDPHRNLRSPRLRKAARWLLRLGRRSLLAPVWRLDEQGLRCAHAWLAERARHPTHKVLIVSGGNVLHRLFETDRGAVTSSVTTLLLKPIREPCTGPFDRVYVRLSHADAWQLPGLAIELLPRLRPGGMLEVFLDHPEGEPDPAAFTADLARHTRTVLPSEAPACRHTVTLMEGQGERGPLQQAWEAASLISVRGRSVGALPRRAAAVLWFAIALVTTLTGRAFGRGATAPVMRATGVIRFEVLPGANVDAKPSPAAPARAEPTVEAARPWPPDRGSVRP